MKLFEFDEIPLTRKDVGIIQISKLVEVKLGTSSNNTILKQNT